MLNLLSSVSRVPFYAAANDTGAAKPAATKPAPKRNRKPAASKPAAAPKLSEAEQTQAIVSRGLARDASGVERQATNFAEYSDRDTAYLHFFGRVMRAHDNTATLAQIHEAGKPVGKNRRVNPHYTGSAKATDVGAINRLVKAGYITQSENGKRLTATPLALSSAAYLGK